MLEHGKEIEPRDSGRGAADVRPCNGIADVYLHRLRADFRTGSAVAGYLFGPLAEAVVFALIASYVLSRPAGPHLGQLPATQAGAHAAHHDAAGIQIRSRQAQPQSLVRFQQGFERRFAASRSFYGGLLDLCLHNRAKVIAGFMGFTFLSFSLTLILGQEFLPERRWRADQDACAGADRYTG